MGKLSAFNVLKALKGEKTKPFKYQDVGMLATIGRNSAVAVLGKLHMSGYPAWLLWLVAHIYFLIGFRNRIVVLIDWAIAYWTFDRNARIVFQGRKDA
jgi:NADH dehydrogenase